MISKEFLEYLNNKRFWGNRYSQNNKYKINAWLMSQGCCNPRYFTSDTPSLREALNYHATPANVFNKINKRRFRKVIRKLAKEHKRLYNYEACSYDIAQLILKKVKVELGQKKSIV